MTFYIPPVFLFGNNTNRFHNNEEEKSEYKTAAETEIKVENWRAKRIAELEEENKKLKSDLSECECSMHFENDEVGYRKRECKKLKEEIIFLEQCLDNKEKVNKQLREELEKRRFSLDEYDYIILTSTTPQIEIIKK